MKIDTKEIIDKIRTVLTSPTKFFNKVKIEKGYDKPFVYYAVLSLVLNILSASVLVVLTGLGLLNAIIQYIGYWIVGLGFIFLGVAIIHAFVYLVGGKNGYFQTFRTAAYAATPSLLFGWIPIIGRLIDLYSMFYLYPKGLSISHNISFGRALLAILLPAIILVILILFFVPLPVE